MGHHQDHHHLEEDLRLMVNHLDLHLALPILAKLPVVMHLLLARHLDSLRMEAHKVNMASRDSSLNMVSNLSRPMAEDLLLNNRMVHRLEPLPDPGSSTAKPLHPLRALAQITTLDIF